MSTVVNESPSGFDEMSLSEATLEALRKVDYRTPTPIQQAFVPVTLEGRDCIGQAQTGTGKTAAFVLPILEAIDESQRAPQALVLVPTRELAVQVCAEAKRLAFGRRFSLAAIYGGQAIGRQIAALERGCQIVVGTPGRLLDHLRRGTLRLDRVRVLVLDEADRMLDIGFRPDIEKILRRAPSQRQTLLLSATMPPAVRRLAEKYMTDPETVDLSPVNPTVASIDQYYVSVDQDRKLAVLVRLLEEERPRQAIIFCRTKRGADRLTERLRKSHQQVGCIHGDLHQRVRDRVMAQFREGKIAYLVATDVVGRGIDVSAISHIINYDIPEFCDDYVHRVGRTGRMGAEGVAYTFVTPDEGEALTSIEMRINRLLERKEIGGCESLRSREPGNGDGAAVATSPAPSTRRIRLRGGRAPRRYRRAL